MNKTFVLNAITVLLFLFLGLRLFQLQIVEHQKYKVLAKNNSTRVSITRAPRGIIYDRNGDILATNKQSLSVVVYPAILRSDEDKESVAKILSNFLSMSYEDMSTMFKKMDPTTPLPLTLDNNIDISQAIKIFDNYQFLPGISVVKQAMRYYPYHEIAVHTLGYVGQVNSRELKNSGHRKLKLGDIVGKEGLEKVFDANLRGKKGEERVPVDRHGRIVSSDLMPHKWVKRAIRGKDLHLTLDIDLQKAAEEAMEGMDGAMVVLNPQNGEILALVSKPGFDPNIFTKPVPSKLYNELSSKKAFLNRATSSFTPGSIWKPITALAALNHKVATRDEYLTVSGSITMGGFRFGDWTSKKDVMNLPMAIAWSRNTYFYQIAKRMQPEWIADLGRSLGAGEKTGVELLGESNGTVPDPEWKKKHLNEPWFPGNTLHFAIGQSFLLVTPLQAAKIVSAIATGGKVPQLHLVKDPKKEKPERQIDIPESSLKIVRDGMRKCISEGTGQATKFKEFTLAGKTGSAEVRGYKHSTHGWFVSYGDASEGAEPEIALACFGEGAGHGGSVCAPRARKVYEVYLKKKGLIKG